MISFPAFFSLFLNFCIFIVSRFSSLCVLTHSLSQPVFSALLNLSEIMTLTKSPLYLCARLSRPQWIPL